MPVPERYSRQVLFDGIGLEGQRFLEASKVVIVGLGALGSVASDQLVRSGVGSLRLIDRDIVELSNLQRQTLYDEEDVRKGFPKAVAAVKKLRRTNASSRLEAIVDDLNPANVEELIQGADLVLDGLDNFETRFILNDACKKTKLTWIYAAAVGSYGLAMPVLQDGPCLRCLIGELPPPGSSPTCDTSGVISPITNVIASIQVALAFRYLTKQLGPADVELLSFDAWSNRFQTMSVSSELRKHCPLCSAGQLDYLSESPLRTISLCGRRAVQLIPAVRGNVDLAKFRKLLESFGPVESNEFLLKCQNPPYELTLFRDGRAIVKGTEEPSVARSVYSKMVGS